MRTEQCPVCFDQLEVRETTPCSYCGTWPESTARFDSSLKFTEYRLPCGQSIVLCQACVLEEFMVPHGWGFELIPGRDLPVDALQPIRVFQAAQLSLDKCCPTCNKRIGLLNVIAASKAG